MGTPKDSEKTKARIIETAGKLFAEKGFKSVTVRDIAAAAGTQISALNYHFRSKEELYRTVVETACMEDMITEDEQAALKRMKPEKALRLLISEMEKVYRKMDFKNWQNKLLTREAHDPSPVFKEAGKLYFRPQAAFMAELIGAVVDRPADNRNVQLAVVTLETMSETVFEYGHLVETVSPGLLEYLGKKGRFTDWLYDLVIYTAGKQEA